MLLFVELHVWVQGWLLCLDDEVLGKGQVQADADCGVADFV